MNNWVRNFSLLLVLGAMLMLGACSSKTNGDTKDSQSIQVVTTIAQIGEPLEVIGGDRIEVKSLMGPGVDPHLYEPTQSDINALQNADMIFYNGLHLEGNMGEVFEKMKETKVTFPLGESLHEEQLLIDEGAIDPHIWFDIELWKSALNAAVEELKKYSPDDEQFFEENKQTYFTQLDRIKTDALVKLTSIPEQQRVLVTAHDAFGYFGRMYDIDVIGLQGLSTEDEVGISDIQSTIDLLIEKQVPAVFVESSVNQNSIKAVIEGAAKTGLVVKLGGELFSDAMGESGSFEGTYIGMYQHNVNTIYEALSGKGDQ